MIQLPSLNAAYQPREDCVFLKISALVLAVEAVGHLVSAFEPEQTCASFRY
jgi:hypothetical protein